MPSTLPEILAERAAQLIAEVEATLSSTTAALPLRRTMERLPRLIGDLVERLRAARIDEHDPGTAWPLELDIVPLVAALGRLRQSIYALIDDEPLAVSPRDERILSDWFAAVAQAALTAENRRFADMLDAVPDHLMLHDREANLIYVNEATADVGRWQAGLNPEETLGRRVIDFVPNKRFGQMVYDNVMRVVAGETITEDFVLPHPDGARWGEHHVLPIHGSHGQIEAIATDSRDMHARKKAEGRLRLLSKLDDLTATTDAEGIVDALARLSLPELADWCIVHTIEDGQVQRATIAHRDPDQAALAAELARIPPQLHTLPVGKLALAGTASLVDDIAAAIAGADPAFIALAARLGMRSAMVIPFNVMGAPVALAVFLVTPESGRRYVADDLLVAQELAQRAAQRIENARLRQQLRHSDQRFRVGLAHAKVSVFETDLALRLRWGYGSLLVDPEGRIGGTLREAFGPEVGGDPAELDRVIATGEGTSRDFSVTRDGARRHFVVRYEPLRDSDEVVVGIIGAVVDVTELKEAEEQLARELAFRERMMGVLGHDLRNPVSAVLAIADLMRLEDGLDDKALEQLGLIQQAARRMNEMIATLLDFTRLRFHGSLPIELAAIDLDELARRVVAELRAAHRGRDIELSSSGNLHGEWDPGRVAQLFTNLVANALTHGERGSPVWITVAGDEDDVVLSVRNRGATIPPALAERLFDPFEQGDDSGTRRRGLGLGLFIVREIVRAHGGTVGVRSGDGIVAFVASLPRSAPTKLDGVTAS